MMYVLQMRHPLLMIGRDTAVVQLTYIFLPTSIFDFSLEKKTFQSRSIFRNQGECHVFQRNLLDYHDYMVSIYFPYDTIQ